MFRNLKIAGDISIAPVPANEKVPEDSWRYIIMGPTGAGKSAYIEALAGGAQNLHISKDQLAGYTQSVAAYQLVNVTRTSVPIYLVDTPGFSDAKISEAEIIEMVRNWMVENDQSYFDTILFLSPITEPRLAGSKRRTIEMLKALLKPSGSLHSISFVTTMWDQLHSERTQQRAESNFAQLRDDILKEFIDKGAVIKQFRNTTASALQILNESSEGGTVPFSDTSDASSRLYQDLHERIQSALQQKKALESDLTDPAAQPNIALKSILQQNHRDNEETLNKFIGQLARFGDIPDGFEDAHQHLHNAIEAMQNTDPEHDDPAFPPEANKSAPYSPHLIEATHTNAAPLHVVTTIGPQPTTFSDPAQSSLPPAVVDHSPTSLVQIHPTRLLILKGLLRRLVRAAKQGGRKWFRKSND